MKFAFHLALREGGYSDQLEWHRVTTRVLSSRQEKSYNEKEIWRHLDAGEGKETVSSPGPPEGDSPADLLILSQPAPFWTSDF